MTKKRKAYSYLRFSTPEQGSGDSLRRQTQMAADYAERHNLELVTKSYADLGVSAFRGANASVGRLNEFIEAVRSGLIPNDSVLLIESLDRLSRAKPRKALRLVEDICDEGVEIVTLSDNRKYDKESLDEDAVSFIAAFMVAMRANEESENKARRLRAAWDAKRGQAANKPITKICPAWLTYSEENETFEVNEGRAEIVQRIFEEAGKGTGLHSIAQALNGDKVPTFGNGTKRAPAKFWYRSYIQKILDNPAVVGTFVPHVTEYRDDKKFRIAQDPIPDYFPRVISDELYNAVASARSVPLAPSVRRASPKVKTFLAGLVVCPKCGGTMTRVTKGSSKKAGKPYLVCVKAKGGAGCTYRTVPVTTVEETIAGNFQFLAENVPSGDDTTERQLDSVEKVLDVLQDEAINLADAIAEAPSRTLRQQLEKKEEQIEKATERRKELIERRVASAPTFAAQRLRDLHELAQAEERDVPAMNNLMRQVFRGVIVDYEEGDLFLEWHNGAQTDLVYAWVE